MSKSYFRAIYADTDYLFWMLFHTGNCNYIAYWIKGLVDNGE